MKRMMMMLVLALAMALVVNGAPAQQTDPEPAKTCRSIGSTEIEECPVACPRSCSPTCDCPNGVQIIVDDPDIVGIVWVWAVWLWI